jgi:hypothetical protein
VALVVRALHQSGPLQLDELADEPDLSGWPAHRIEHAIVAAWARNLISFDPRDLLVAL